MATLYHSQGLVAKLNGINLSIDTASGPIQLCLHHSQGLGPAKLMMLAPRYPSLVAIYPLCFMVKPRF